MTPTNVQEQIREQLAALRRTTDKATESKEAALKATIYVLGLTPKVAEMTKPPEESGGVL
jgi:hypothetical protein